MREDGRRSFWRDRPWWIPHFLGSVPEVEKGLLNLLGLVSLALFFEQYDASMLSSALKYIAEDLGMSEANLGRNMGIIRLGALPALLVLPLADRLGRRRVFIASVLGYSLATFATAFMNSPASFIAMQMTCRIFMVSAAATSVVIITEEFPPDHRGWALGMMGALAACGHGLGAGLFSAIEVLPYGWRALYFFGLIPLALVPSLIRHVPETRRYSLQQAERELSGEAGTGPSGWLKPFLSLATAYPARTLGVTIIALISALSAASVFQFYGYYLLTDHGWSPGQYSTMVILAGMVGIVGNVVAGRLADRWGRRVVASGFMLLFPVAVWCFFRGSGWMLPAGWMMIAFMWMACEVMLRAFATELFPTSYRGTAAGWTYFIQTIGWTGGLWLLGASREALGGIAEATSWLSLFALIGAVAVLFLPESGGRELEDISQEGGASVQSTVSP